MHFGPCKYPKDGKDVKIKNTLTDVGPDRTWFIAVYWYFIGVDGDTAVNTVNIV